MEERKGKNVMGKYEKAARTIREKQDFQKEQQRLHAKYEDESAQVVIKETSNMAKFTVKTLSSLLRILTGVLLLCLSAIGILSLVYPQTREPLLVTLHGIFQEIFGMLE